MKKPDQEPKKRFVKFLDEGQQEVIDYRTELADFSLKKAALRIYQQKIKRLSTDPITEELMHDNELKPITKYNLESTEFGDTSSISRGIMSQDDSIFAISGWSGNCKIYDMKGDEPEAITNLKGHAYQVYDINYHPLFGKNLQDKNCPQIATCGADTTVKLWTFDPEQQNQNYLELQGHTDRVNRVRFHPMGAHILSSSHDKTVKLWDIEKEKCVTTLSGHKSGIYGLAVHMDGALCYSGDLSGLGMCWDQRISKPVLPQNGHVKSILTGDFHSDGYRLATGGEDNQIRIWDLRRKVSILQIPAHKKLISDLQFQRVHSRFLVSSSYDGSVKIWSTKDFSLITSLELEGARISSANVGQNLDRVITTTMERKWHTFIRDDTQVDTPDDGDDKMLIED